MTQVVGFENGKNYVISLLENQADGRCVSNDGTYKSCGIKYGGPNVRTFDSANSAKTYNDTIVFKSGLRGNNSFELRNNENKCLTLNDTNYYDFQTCNANDSRQNFSVKNIVSTIHGDNYVALGNSAKPSCATITNNQMAHGQTCNANVVPPYFSTYMLLDVPDYSIIRTTPVNNAPVSSSPISGITFDVGPEPTPPPPAPASVIDPQSLYPISSLNDELRNLGNNEFYFQSANKNNLCINDGGGTSPGQTKFHLWNCDNNDNNQKLVVNKIYSDGTFSFRNPYKNNLCLDDGGGATAGSTKMHLYTCDDGNPNQRFAIKNKMPNGSVVIGLNPNKPNLCLDDGGGTEPGKTNIHIWNCDPNNSNQQFFIKQVPKPTPVPTPAPISNPNCDWPTYALRHPDLLNSFCANQSKLENHYNTYGKSEGRNCEPDQTIWSCDAYLNRYPELKNAYGNDCTNAFAHYVINGKNEGRNPAK